VTVLTGAGVSAESGIPTFRDALTGFWANFKAEELATVEAFRRNPKLVWDWYATRRKMAADVQPNAGHVALCDMGVNVPEFTVITQNVDGLHQRAGSKSVIELHGSLWRVKCLDEGDIFTTWTDVDGDVPRCPRCRRSYLRPDIVWFGEFLSEDDLSSARSATARCDVFLSIGTSGTVHPAASLLGLAAQSGAFTCVVNKDVTGFDNVDCALEGRSGEILPALVEQVWWER